MPSVERQVEVMSKKFYQRLWVLCNLKKVDIPKEDMLALYNSLIRLVLEFAAPAFHSLLTTTQAGELERIQAQAFKIIYGGKTPFRMALEISGAEKLLGEGKNWWITSRLNVQKKPG